MKKFICTFAAIIVMSISVFADINLPEGFVKGLPENLIAMDEEGYSPDPSNGELYISIPDMIPGELYTKDVSLMNLRDDAEYNIYMTATPNYSKGNVDMLNETSCRLYLDDKLIYEGLVNGDGTPNMQKNGLNLGGIYKSGVSRKLHAEFVWNWSGQTTYDLEDKNSYYGEVSFYWTFYAQIEKGNTHNSDGSSSGGGGGGKIIRHNPSDNTDVPSDTDDTVDVDNPSGTDKISDTDNPLDTDDSISTDNPGNNPHDSVSDEADYPNPADLDESDKPGIIDKIVNKLPLIPEDVKTGYHSEIVFYTKIAVIAFGAAFLIVLFIIYKMIKLRNIKRNSTL